MSVFCLYTLKYLSRTPLRYHFVKELERLDVFFFLLATFSFLFDATLDVLHHRRSQRYNGLGGRGQGLSGRGKRGAFNRIACLLITRTGRPKVNAIIWKPFNSGVNGGAAKAIKAC